LSAAYADDLGGDIAAHLGEVLWQLGKQDAAQKIWSEAAAVDADNALLRSTRQRLNPAP
jgi:predicted negative regulator of RcsB-dependent stress response